MAGTELLDRDRELRAVDGLVAQAAEGEARLVLIEGAAGIGKTRLLGEARRRAEAAGMRALTARGSELEREFAFGVVRQLFEPLLGHERQRALAGAAATAEAVFTAPAGADVADSSFAALHGLYWLATNLTEEGPLALVVDDLHWCDRASLRFLAYLARRLESLPVLVAASLRPGPARRAASRSVLLGLAWGCSDSQMLHEVTSETIDRILAAAAPTPESPLGIVELRHLGGALRRRPEGAGVVGSFEAEYLAFAAGPAFDPASTAAVEAQLALVRDALSPEDSGREYLNFAERTRDAATFFGTRDAARLRAVKARVDPERTVPANHPV